MRSSTMRHGSEHIRNPYFTSCSGSGPPRLSDHPLSLVLWYCRVLPLPGWTPRTSLVEYLVKDYVGPRPRSSLSKNLHDSPYSKLPTWILLVPLFHFPTKVLNIHHIFGPDFSPRSHESFMIHQTKPTPPYTNTNNHSHTHTRKQIVPSIIDFST